MTPTRHPVAKGANRRHVLQSQKGEQRKRACTLYPVEIRCVGECAADFHQQCRFIEVLHLPFGSFSNYAKVELHNLREWGWGNGHCFASRLVKEFQRLVRPTCCRNQPVFYWKIPWTDFDSATLTHG